jgi:alkanesulfonate monooxygenase SsuD/methylene tetrahydromethanopterin reductase-like flavin-dependent oxidoreductase (luciferase family)
VDEGYEIFPQPVQQPHPPFYMGAGTEDSMRFAAQHGFGLMQSSLPSVETIGEHIEFYRKYMADAPAPLNQNPAFGEVDVVRMVYVASTDQKAKQESEAGITHHMKTFLSGGNTGGYLGDVTEKQDEKQFTYDHLAQTTILHGSPDTVIRRIEEFRKVGTTSIMLHYPPYYGVEQTLNMLRLFAKEVLPYIQTQCAA